MIRIYMLKRFDYGSAADTFLLHLTMINRQILEIPHKISVIFSSVLLNRLWNGITTEFTKGLDWKLGVIALCCRLWPNELGGPPLVSGYS